MPTIRYDHDGHTVDFLNDTGAALVAGDFVEKNFLLGVVVRDTPIGKHGALYSSRAPVFLVPIAPADVNTYAIGVQVKYNPATKAVDVAGGTGTIVGSVMPTAKKGLAATYAAADKFIPVRWLGDGIPGPQGPPGP